MTAISRRALVAMLRRAQRDRDRLLELVGQQRGLIQEQRRAYDELVRDLAEVKAGLAQVRELAHRYRMLDYAASCERDLSAPLQ